MPKYEWDTAKIWVRNSKNMSQIQQKLVRYAETWATDRAQYVTVARHFAQHESVMQNNVPDIVNLVLEKALKRARYASNMGQKEHKWGWYATKWAKYI